jgi:hypothetical protein
MAKDGTDWSGAFGEDPAALVGKEKEKERERESGGSGSGERDGPPMNGGTEEEGGYEDSSDENDEDVDLGVDDATHDKGKQRASVGSSEEGEDGNYTWRSSQTESNGRSRKSTDSTATGGTDGTGNTGTGNTGKSGSSKNPLTQYREYRNRSRDLHRKHRGLMQW